MSINYEINDRFRPGLRLGVDEYLEFLSVEGVVAYDILNKEEYELYAGLGIRSFSFTG